MKSPLIVLAAASAALTLAGCGKMGNLERPGPLFGQGRATTADSDERQRQAQDPSRPVDTVDTRDASADPAPPRAIPIQGSGSDPTRPSPQGSIPNPYANPQ